MILGEELQGRGRGARGASPSPRVCARVRVCASGRPRDEGISKSGCLGSGSAGGREAVAPTRLRIARNWVTLPGARHSLQPRTIISFLPDSCPFKEQGRPAAGMCLEAEGVETDGVGSVR